LPIKETRQHQGKKITKRTHAAPVKNGRRVNHRSFLWWWKSKGHKKGFERVLGIIYCQAQRQYPKKRGRLRERKERNGRGGPIVQETGGYSGQRRHQNLGGNGVAYLDEMSGGTASRGLNATTSRGWKFTEKWWDVVPGDLEKNKKGREENRYCYTLTLN